MRADIVTNIKTALAAVPGVVTVCGLGFDKPAYPIIRVWARGTGDANLDNSPQARIDLRLIVQIETHLEVDDDGATIDDGLYDLVDSVFAVLHGYQLPGRGSQPVIVLDNPGILEFGEDKRATYQLQASVRVMPDLFALT